jgi:hypothetical protein
MQVSGISSNLKISQKASWLWGEAIVEKREEEVLALLVQKYLLYQHKSTCFFLVQKVRLWGVAIVEKREEEEVLS